ncbi:MAG TPA: hypothetical protein VJR30_14885, partial [Bradyrhizobium sp.]|nr:hypothetical protein [Bradyrhizobium sp.]
ASAAQCPFPAHFFWPKHLESRATKISSMIPDAKPGPVGHRERRLLVTGASHAQIASFGGFGNETEL